MPNKVPTGDVRANGLWAFCLALYTAPGVEQACLWLQDHRGVDVPLLLAVAWAGRRGIALSETDVAGLRQSVAEWHDQVVRPLRSVRRHLKIRAISNPEIDALRTKIKAIELESERIEIASLERGLLKLGSSESMAGIAANLRLVVEAYGRPSAKDMAAIRQVAAGAADVPWHPAPEN